MQSWPLRAQRLGGNFEKTPLRRKRPPLGMDTNLTFQTLSFATLVMLPKALECNPTFSALLISPRELFAGSRLLPRAIHSLLWNPKALCLPV
mmetsp:Transcript_34463/g.63694  ORF Transcript_34463/g.63694 Transcript_34463/m.63694 type:complete len:92 (+) Transcript_34463:121-396(+)